MILGGEALNEAFRSGTWTAYRDKEEVPADEISRHIGPNSIDVTLSDQILRLPPEMINQQNPRAKSEKPLDIFDHRVRVVADRIRDYPAGLVLAPGDFILGCVNERFDCREPLEGAMSPTGDPMYFAPMYEGRSTLGRCGIGTHVTAGFGDYGFTGAFTLEIFNVGPRPVKLYPGIRVGQVFFMPVHRPKVYAGAYRGTDHDHKPVGPVLGSRRFLFDALKRR